MSKVGQGTPGNAGVAGQLAVMAQFAARGYNVAIPMIDEGCDALVINRMTGDSWRIQAKYATENRRAENSGQFSIHVKKKAIYSLTSGPDLYYVFVLAKEHGWRYLTFSHEDLQKYVGDGAGTDLPKHKTLFRNFCITLRDEVSDKQVLCSKQNWTRHLDNWDVWPTLRTAQHE